ncbi:MAG TPA: glycosyltransferase, partial [Solirubrobacteraceae bacterium]|nr:glycosyltransferase [Solirubrobacteraceae bacterium]
MAPTASIIVPTRLRAGYLEVALASIAPQAAASGAEVLVVDDGPDARTRACAQRHAARYVAHETSRGLNAARNTGIDAARSDLLVFVDDDVEVRAGWLDALLAADAAAGAEVAVLTGPIHARFEDHRWRSCGREGAPITTQDHGPRDRDVRSAWGANMTLRRTAIARAGRFDEARERGWPAGIVDATPILHTTPVGGGYDRAAAVAEARSFLATRPYVTREQARATLDGIDVAYVPFLAPPRPRAYGRWGRWAAPPLALALRALRRAFPYNLVHAHNAVPAGEAVRRAGLRVPYVVSVHGGDVFHTVPRSRAGAEAVRAALGCARLVLANSAGIEERCRVLGAPATRVVRLGSDLPERRAEPYA